MVYTQLAKIFAKGGVNQLRSLYAEIELAAMCVRRPHTPHRHMISPNFNNLAI